MNQLLNDTKTGFAIAAGSALFFGLLWWASGLVKRPESPKQSPCGCGGR